MSIPKDFYVRYYVGHKGRFGHEFLEFEFRSDGRLRYANNSKYKNEQVIRKEVFVSQAVLGEVLKLIEETEIEKEDDREWPQPDRIGRQELEIKKGNNYVSFTTSKIGSINSLVNLKDSEGLKVYYYLIQNLKMLVFSLMSLHFRIKPLY